MLDSGEISKNVFSSRTCNSGRERDVGMYHVRSLGVAGHSIFQQSMDREPKACASSSRCHLSLS
jgi:hypothetical protein